MDRTAPPRHNTFAGLSLILDRVAERRDESMWINELAASDSARYVLIDPLGQTYLRAEGPALRWLDSAERERLLGDAKASFLGLTGEQPNFHFVPMLSDPTPDDAWTGRTGFVHQGVMQDLPDLSRFQVYACGAPAMVDAARKDFAALCGLPEDQFFADAFTSEADLAKG